MPNISQSAFNWRGHQRLNNHRHYQPTIGISHDFVGIECLFALSVDSYINFPVI